MNAPYKTLVATFTGGFLGTLSMRALSPSFWWIGMIVGAVVGFIINSEEEIRDEIAGTDFSLEPNIARFCKDFFIPIVEGSLAALRWAIKQVVMLLVLFTFIITVVYNVWGMCGVIKEFSLAPLIENLYIMTFWQWVWCHIVLATAFAASCDFDRSLKKRAVESLLITSLLSPVSFVVVFPLICIVLSVVITYQLAVWTGALWRSVMYSGSKIWNDTTYACATASALGSCIGHYAGNNPLVGGGVGLLLALARIKIQETVLRMLPK